MEVLEQRCGDSSTLALVLAFSEPLAFAFADAFGAALFDEFLSGGHSCGVHGVGMELMGSVKDSVWVVFCVESVEQKGGECIC